MHDDLRRMIEALRLKTPALPDGFATAPILDQWAFHRAYGSGPLRGLSP
jgi:hypothetical protein